MLEIDGLIVYTGDYDWRVQLTDKGCKAAQMGLLRYLKRQKLIEKMKEYKLFVGIASAIVSFVSMLMSCSYNLQCCKIIRAHATTDTMAQTALISMIRMS